MPKKLEPHHDSDAMPEADVWPIPDPPLEDDAPELDAWRLWYWKRYLSPCFNVSVEKAALWWYPRTHSEVSFLEMALLDTDPDTLYIRLSTPTPGSESPDADTRLSQLREVITAKCPGVESGRVDPLTILQWAIDESFRMPQELLNIGKLAASEGAGMISRAQIKKRLQNQFPDMPDNTALNRIKRAEGKTLFPVAGGQFEDRNIESFFTSQKAYKRGRKSAGNEDYDAYAVE